jgi:acetylornithine/N-succinyldiaminopimelate aminotransferase
MDSSQPVSGRLQAGDHGGTFGGNPLACAVAYAVLHYLLENDVTTHVEELGRDALSEMTRWLSAYPDVVTDVGGRGLLLIAELRDEQTAAQVAAECLSRKVFVRQTQGNGIRVVPALNIEQAQLGEGLETLRQAIAAEAVEKR